ncbi:MAG: hypothetical protein WBI74_07405 [Caldicoprobacterales bacterium]|jgi:hypothetical protein
MISMWNKEVEKRFFVESLKSFSTPEQLFYVTNDGRYFAYWPKNYKGPKSTIQSRNTLIGNYTEKWATDLFHQIADENNLYAIQGAICPEIDLSSSSPADIVISKEKGVRQTPDNILLIIEVKMSLVWNWELTEENEIKCVGDYSTHQGNPSLLRSDSMLKAIGKSINIRVSNYKAAKIPIIVIGNTPITKNYYTKVDNLKTSGIIQGFWSVNPKPLDNDVDSLKNTDKYGFYRYDIFEELRDATNKLLEEERNFFAGMKSNKELGQIIEQANKAKTYEEKGKLFLKLLEE